MKLCTDFWVVLDEFGRFDDGRPFCQLSAPFFYIIYTFGATSFWSKVCISSEADVAINAEICLGLLWLIFVKFQWNWPESADCIASDIETRNSRQKAIKIFVLSFFKLAISSKSNHSRIFKWWPPISKAIPWWKRNLNALKALNEDCKL